MKVKKIYKSGDSVWIYGVSVGLKNRLTEATVVSAVDLSAQGYLGPHYVLAVPSSIEPLLLIRTWETMSQDEHGPVGALREIASRISTDAEYHTMSYFGWNHEADHDIGDDDEDEDVVEPLDIPEPAKPKRRYYRKKK